MYDCSFVLVPAFVAPAVTFATDACRRYACVPCYESPTAPSQPLRKKLKDFSQLAHTELPQAELAGQTWLRLPQRMYGEGAEEEEEEIATWVGTVGRGEACIMLGGQERGRGRSQTDVPGG